MATAGAANSPIETAQIGFAYVDFLKAGAPHPHRSGFRRLRQGAELHVTLNGTAVSSVAGLPPLLKQGSYYIPAEQARAGSEDQQIVIGANAPTRVYLLWPALQDLPGWCYQEFELVRGAEVKVHWSRLTTQQRLYLNVTNRRRLYDDQSLLVFRLRGNNGYLMPGEEIELPYSVRRQDFPPQQPCYSHVLCLQPTSQVSGSGSGASNSTSGTGAKPLSGNSLAEITMALEDGVLNPAELANKEADRFLRLAIAAANEELLFMLLDGGIGPKSSQPCLQLVLRYAQYEDLPLLALTAVQQSPVEITQPVLEWLVGHMVRRKMLKEAEVTLTQYCLSRRNPLSTVAAIEHALHKAAHSQLVVNQDVLQLAMKFKTAKLSLLQGLVQHYSGDNLEHRQFSSSGMPSGHRFLMQEVTASSNSDTPPLLRVNALQQAVRRCLQKTSAYMVGRGSSRAPVSIHDVSPYNIAIGMQDVEFLQHPAVVDYSNRVWRGLELQKMAQAWQAAVSHAVHLGSSGDWGLVERKGPCRRSAGAGRKASVCGAITRPPAGNRAGSFLMGSFIDARGNSGFAAWGRPIGVQSAELDTAAAASATLPAVPAPNVTPAADTSSQPEPAPGAYQQQRADLATAEEGPTEASRPVVNARLSTSFKGGPLAEAAEYGFLDSSGAVTPAAPAVSSQVRRRTTQDWATVTSSEDLEQPGASHYSKTAWEGAVWLDPEAGSQLLQNLGLAGGTGQALCSTALSLLHGVLLTPRAVQNRAKNRWTQRCIFEIWFLIVFVGYSFGYFAFLNCLPSLLMLVLGNIIGIAFEVRWIHNGNIKTYFRQHFSKIDVIVNFGFLLHLTWELVVEVLGYNNVYDHSTMAQMGIPVQQVVASAYSVLVWARALGVFTPADARVGAMLFTLGRAAEEAAAFVPLVLVLIFGFSSTLYVMYHNLFEDYSTILGALRMFALLSLGGHHSLLEFEHGEHKDPFLVVWGQVIVILYGIIFNILILTLLIAVITKTYSTKSIKAKAVLMEAEAVNQYEWRVRHHLSASPINLWQVAFSWLPQGYRSRVPPAKCLRFGIPPLDGYVPELIAASPHMLLPTGPPEISYIWFIILQCSLLSLVALILLVLHLPFGVWHFASRGRLMWEDSTWTGKDNQFTTERKNPASAAAAAARKSRRTDSSSGVAGGGSGHCDCSLDLATPADSFISGTSDCGAVTRRHQTTAEGEKPSLQSIRALAATKKHLKAAVDTGIKAGRGGGTGIRCGAKRAARALARLINKAGRVAVALVFALAAHLLLLLVATVAIVVAQASRLVFSLYCIFAPRAADCNCCMRPTRYADFWTQSDLRAALESAKLTVEQTYSTVHSLASGDSATNPGKSPVQPYTDATCQVSTRPTRFITADDVLTHHHHVTLMSAPTRPVAGRQPQLEPDAVMGGSTLLWPTLPSLEAEVDSCQHVGSEAATRKLQPPWWL